MEERSLPLFDTIVESIAKLMGLEPERAPGRRERGREPARTLGEAAGGQADRAEPEDDAGSGTRPELEPEAAGIEVESQPEPRAQLQAEPVPAGVEELLEQVMEVIPKVLAVAAVDLGSRRLLATKLDTPLPEQVRERLAAATRELLDAPYFAATEAALGPARDEQPAEVTRQAIVFSSHLVHLFVRLGQYPSLVLVVVCRADTNLGLALARLRRMNEIDMIDAQGS